MDERDRDNHRHGDTEPVALSHYGDTPALEGVAPSRGGVANTFGAAVARDTGRGTRATVTWLGTEAGRNALYSVVPPVLVTGCANLAAHQLATVETGLCAAVVALASGYLGVKGLAHKWSPAATYTFLGLSAMTINTGVTVVGGGWVDVIAMALFGAASLGGRLAFLHGTSEKRAKARTEVAKANLLEAKAQLTLLKAQTEQLNAQFKHAKLTRVVEPAPAYTPNLAGLTPEETAIRTAFWNVHQAELLGCQIEYTRTGYSAIIGLPTKLARDNVRQGWDHIGSALRSRGRFVPSNGHFTNELVVKFLDDTKRDTTDVTWHEGLLSPNPLLMSIGVNTETGEPVMMQADERTLVCGASGTGKSYSMRPMLAHALAHGDLLFIDGKGEDASVVGDVARVAVDPDDITGAVDEAYEEMMIRKEDMRKRKIRTWDREQLTLAVDEGQVVLAIIASDKKEGPARMQRLRELTTTGRSRGVVVWWCTQKPTMSGSAPGVETMMAPNLIQRFSLRVADGTEARTALDDCAHYGPNLIPDSRDMRGHGYLKGYGPSLIRTWNLDDDTFRSLPRKVWGTSAPRNDQDRVVRYFIENPNGSNVKAADVLGFSEAKVRRLRKLAGPVNGATIEK